MSIGSIWSDFLTGAQIKQYIPFAIAVLVTVCCQFWGADITALFLKKDVSFTGVYSAVFDWSAIQTGFLFSVLGYIGGKTGGFISAIQGTPAMSRFVSRIKRATTIGFVLTITSMPLVMFNPSIYKNELTYNLIAVWFGFFVWAFLSFLRVAYDFGRIITVEKPQ